MKGEEARSRCERASQTEAARNRWKREDEKEESGAGTGELEGKKKILGWKGEEGTQRKREPV